MKTKNNVQKAILRSVAVVVSFVLISFTVSAQDFWKRLIENSSFSHIALAMVESPSDTKLTPAPVKSLDAMCFENEVEPAMEVEDWMTDYTKFNVEFRYEQEIETGLDVEDWMTNEVLFQVGNENDDTLELEGWMVSEEVWNI